MRNSQDTFEIVNAGLYAKNFLLRHQIFILKEKCQNISGREMGLINLIRFVQSQWSFIHTIMIAFHSKRELRVFIFLVIHIWNSFKIILEIIEKELVTKLLEIGVKLVEEEEKVRKRDKIWVWMKPWLKKTISVQVHTKPYSRNYPWKIKKNFEDISGWTLKLIK